MSQNNEGRKMLTVYEAFCDECGSILPDLVGQKIITCYYCKKTFPISVFCNSSYKFSIPFNRIVEERIEGSNVMEDDEEEGPVLDRKCPRCNNEKMSYATLQLRSADEGQTVFYTCTKCKFKETENS